MQSNPIHLIDDLVSSNLFRTEPQFAKIVADLTKVAQVQLSEPEQPATAGVPESFQAAAARVAGLTAKNYTVQALQKMYACMASGRPLPSLSTELSPKLLDAKDRQKIISDLQQFYVDIVIAAIVGIKDDADLQLVLIHVRPLLDQADRPLNPQNPATKTRSQNDLDFMRDLMSYNTQNQAAFNQLVNPATIKNELLATRLQPTQEASQEASPISTPTEAQILSAVTRYATEIAGTINQFDHNLQNHTKSAIQIAESTIVAELFRYFSENPKKVNEWQLISRSVVEVYICAKADIAGRSGPVKTSPVNLDKIAKESARGLGHLPQTVGPAWLSFFPLISKEIGNFVSAHTVHEMAPEDARAIYNALRPKVAEAIKAAASKCNATQFGDYLVANLEQPWNLNQAYTKQGTWFQRGSSQSVVNTGTAMSAVAVLRSLNRKTEPKSAARWLFDQIRSAGYFAQHGSLPHGITPQSPPDPKHLTQDPEAETGPQAETEPSEPWNEQAAEWLSPDVVGLACSILFKLLLFANQFGGRGF